MSAVVVTEDSIVTQAYELHRESILRHIAAYIRDRDAAEDIVQEAFLRLTQHARGGTLPRDLGAWTYRVARNLATSRGRSLAVARRHESDLPRPLPEPDAGSTVETRELADTVREVLEGMEPDARLAVLLAANGYPGSAAATLLGRSGGAARTLLCRARADVRAELERDGTATAR